MNNHRSLLTTALLACALLIASCSSGASSDGVGDAQGESGSEKLTVLTDYLVFGRHAPLYVARDKGFFEDAGLDVTIGNGKGTNDVLARLGAGKADAVFASMAGLMSATGQGLDAKMVALMYNKNPEAVFYKKSSGITGPRDLEGKKVALAAGTSIAALLPGLLTQNGLDIKAVKTASLAPEALNPALLTGKVDAMLEFSFNAAQLQAAAASADDIGYFLYADHDFAFYGNGYVVKDELIRSSPDVVKRFTNAVVKGYEYAVEHPDEACELLRKDVPDVDAQACLREMQVVKQLVITDETEEHGVGYMDPAKVDATIALLSPVLDIMGDIKGQDIFTGEFLDQ
jgi:NitT/TauT family transport system substrate-binding protein